MNWFSTFAGWIIAFFYIIVERAGLLEKLELWVSKKLIPIGPYKWADKEIPKSLREEEKWFFFITGDMDFLDEPWGKDFFDALIKKKEAMGRDKVRIVISGTSDKAQQRMDEFKSYGFEENVSLLRYEISGGLQAAALNERKCLVKISNREVYSRKSIREIDATRLEEITEAHRLPSYKKLKKLCKELDPKFYRKVNKKLLGRFNILWDPNNHKFYIKRAIVKEYAGVENIDIKKLIEGYFGGAPAIGRSG